MEGKDTRINQATGRGGAGSSAHLLLRLLEGERGGGGTVEGVGLSIWSSTPKRPSRLSGAAPKSGGVDAFD